MHHKDVIETHLTITKPCSIADYNEFCLNELRRLYEGKCFRGKYISSIESIVERSSVVINAAPIGTANVNVKFKAKTIVYPVGTILTNCVVSRIDQTRRIMLLKDNVGIFISKDPRLLSLKPGHIINVRVGDARYSINSRKVGVKAVPYIFPEPDNNVYEIDMKTITDEEMNILSGLLEEKDNKISEKLWNMFYLLYYPYKKEPKVPKGAKKMSLLKLPKSKLYIQRPPAINEADSDVYVFEKPPENFPVIPESPFIILDMMLKRCSKHTKLLEEMCLKFSKESVRTKNKAVWLIHNKLKTEAPNSSKNTGG